MNEIICNYGVYEKYNASNKSWEANNVLFSQFTSCFGLYIGSYSAIMQ